MSYISTSLSKAELPVKSDDKTSQKSSSTKPFAFIGIYTLNILITILFLLVIVYLIMKPHTFQGKNIDEFSNNYCQEESGDLHDLICTNKYFKYPYKKNKFIWIMTDGTAVDEVVELHNLNKYKITTSMKVVGKNFKLTDELHQALITGKRSRNYYGKTIKIDHLIGQFTKNGRTIHYRGWDHPMAALLGEGKDGINKKRFFKKSFIDNGHEFLNFYSFCNFTNPFPFLQLYFDTYQKSQHLKIAYENYSDWIKEYIDERTDQNKYLKKNISKEIFFKDLDEFFEDHPIDLLYLNITYCLEKSFLWNKDEDISILYYTTEMDHFNHLFGKKHVNSIVNSYITEKMILYLMNWIDDNPEYALIVTTDHGGQEFYGEDLIRNHGFDIKGNEGIFYIYTKELKDHFDELNTLERYIDIVDETAIIPQILIDVNIPIYSEGIPYPIIEDNTLAYSALKAKEIQLINQIEAYSKKYSERHNSLIEIKKELKKSLSDFGSIKKYFYTENKSMKKEFNNLIKDNLEKIKKHQKQLIRKFKSYNISFENLITFASILILSIFLILLGIFYIFSKIYNPEFKKLFMKCDKKYKYKYFTLQFISLILLILLILPNFVPYIFIGVGMVNKFIFLIVGSFIIKAIISIIIYLVFCKSEEIVYLNKICTFTFTIFYIFIFVIIFYYPECFRNLKEFFSKYGAGKWFDIIFYPFFIGEIAYELRKYRNKMYFIFCKERKLNVFWIIIPINILFLFFTGFQDMTVRLYHSGQEDTNIVANIICFVLLIINLIISNITVFKYENSNDEEQNNNQVNIKDNEIMSTNDDKNKKNSEIKRKCINGLPFIKLCLVNLCFWLSDESERIFLILLLLPSIEYFFYLSDYFYIKLVEILYFPYNQIFPSSVVVNFEYENIQADKPNKKNNLNGGKNTDIKNETDKINKYIISFIFFIFAENSIIHINHCTFLLTQHSYEFSFSNKQNQKIIFANFLKVLVEYFGKFKFSFVTAGFIISRRNLLFNEKIKNYSIIYTIPRVLLFLKINLDLIFFSSFTFKEVNNDVFVNLVILSIIDLIIVLIDFLELIISKIIYHLYKCCLPFDDYNLSYSSIYNDDWKCKKS